MTTNMQAMPAPKSAVEFSSCATADHAHVLRCDVVAADTTPSANTGWMWASGDTRRVYLKVAVDDDVETRTLAGSAQLRFLSDAGVLRVFDRPWQVDVLPVLDTSTPLIDTIEPTGDPVVIGGTTEPGRALTICERRQHLGESYRRCRGRWRPRCPGHARHTHRTRLLTTCTRWRRPTYHSAGTSQLFALFLWRSLTRRRAERNQYGREHDNEAEVMPRCLHL